MNDYRANVTFEVFFEAKNDQAAERLMNKLIDRLAAVKTGDLGGACWPECDWDIYLDPDSEVA